jgi:hypothetical protein
MLKETEMKKGAAAIGRPLIFNSPLLAPDNGQRQTQPFGRLLWEKAKTSGVAKR